MIKRFIIKLHEYLAEPNGAASAGRLCAFIIVVTACGCMLLVSTAVLYLTIKAGHLPELGDVVKYVTATAYVLTSAGGTFYGSNKLTSYLRDRLGNTADAGGTPNGNVQRTTTEAAGSTAATTAPAAAGSISA